MVKKIVMAFLLRWHGTYKSEFTFTGSGENLEDLLARIETPFIQGITIHPSHQVTDSRQPELCQFICRTEALRSQNQATIAKHEGSINHGSSGGPIDRIANGQTPSNHDSKL